MSVGSITSEDVESEGAETVLAPALPDWLAKRVDPAVWAALVEAVEDRLSSKDSDAGLRYECARVMAGYFERSFNED